VARMYEPKGPEFLKKYVDRWETDLGKWFPGERVVFRGKDLLTELKDMSWMGLFLYGITGRFFKENQIRLLEGICTLTTSYPEPRLWNNRIAALAGTARSSGKLGLAAAIAVSEAKIYGHRANAGTVDFLFEAKEVLEAGDNLEQFVYSQLAKKRKIGGFGRPLTDVDERIGPLMNLAESLSLAQGAFVRMVFEIKDILKRRTPPLQMNVSALATALIADQGLSKQEISHYRASYFSIGIIPCYIDAATKPEGAFFPLSCERIKYEGRARRKWAP
jgi:citrate synthase